MVRPRQVGPDLPSGVRRPDRAVSLFDFDEFDRMISEGTSEAERTPWDLVEDPATGELVERGQGPDLSAEIDYYANETLPSMGLPELDRAIEESEAIPIDDRTDRGQAWLDAAIEERRKRAEAEPAAGEEAAGLTADEAFQQHHAARRIDPKQGEFPGMGGWREQLEAAREKVAPRTPEEQAAWERALRERSGSPRPVVEPPPIPPPLSQMAGPDWEAIEEGDYGAGNWWDTVPGMDDLGDALPDPDEPLNPELRSMDSQMLADMMVAQPEQGYFGGLGDAVQGLTNRVAGMSGQERAALIAALVAAGLITVGSGGMLTPVGVGLAGGAGLTALNQ